jgi:hypothetical protein
MRLFVCATVIILAGLFWSPAQAADAPSVDKKKAENKLVCQTYAKIGTLFKRKVCRTQAEWDADTKAAQELMKKPRIESTPAAG